jgi:potassium/chloride transporter 4/5/6
MEHSSELTLFGKDQDQFQRKLKYANGTTETLEETKDAAPTVVHKKGSISGVFIPTCENMWGVLIFLKFYYLIGMASFSQTLLAVLLSALAAYATTVCLTAIASSGGMLSEGGPYYMISRALGPSIGAAVGLVYWTGITLLAVLESVGAKESMELIFPPADYPLMEAVWLQKLMGVGMISICSLSVYGGSNVVTKLGVVFAVIVVATIVMFYVGIGGALAKNEHSFFAANWGFDQGKVNIGIQGGSTYGGEGVSKASLGSTLGIFFPCFTGMLSGADRADVLINPARSIRYGTFAALTLSLVMYLSFLFLWSGVGERCSLLGVAPTDPRGLRMCRNSQPVEFVKNYFSHKHETRVKFFTPAKLRAVFGADYDDDVLNHFTQHVHHMHDVVGDLFGPKTRYVAYVGILLSCIAQVLQCLMVAPRLMQAIANDSIIPIFKALAPLSANGEARRALGVTYIVAVAMVLALNSLEQAATLVSICFLVCYAFLSVTCCLLTILRTTTWRPEGIFHKRWRMWYIVWGLLGFGVSIFIMVDVGAQYSLFVFLLSVALYLYIEFRGSAVEWGSGLDGFRFNFAMKILQGLSHKPERKINWRPQILVLMDASSAPATCQQPLTPTPVSGTDATTAVAGGPIISSPKSGDNSQMGLVRLVGQLRKGKGMCIAASIFETRESTEGVRRKMENERKRLEKLMDKEQIFGFTEVFQCASFGQGAQQAVQLCGLGGMRPNTVLFEWPEGARWRKDPRRATDFVRLIDFSLKAEKAVLCPKSAESLNLEARCVGEGTIDLWWFIHDGGLLILLTWLLSQHKVWRGCKVRIFIVMEEVGALAANKAAKEFEDKLRRKKILPDGVSVEAVLLGDRAEMIAPYTYDWTLRAEQKKPAAGHGDLPVMLDDLFKTEEELENEAIRAKQRPIDVEAQDEAAIAAGATDDLWTRLTGEAVVAAEQTEKVEEEGVKEVNEEELLSSVHSRLKEKRKALLKESGTKTLAVTNVDIMHRPSSVSLATPAAFEHLNKVLLSKSANSSLVLMNLPNIWGLSEQDCLAYVAYCDCLTQGLERVIFAHGAGNEIFSLF